MPEPVTLEEIKEDLRLEASNTSDDRRLNRLIVSARRMVELKTSRTIVGAAPTITGADLELAVQAISMMVATWYACPEGVSVDSKAASAETPLGCSWIIDQLQRWDDGADS